MEYNLYLKYEAVLDLNLDDRLGELCDFFLADIMYVTNDEENDMDKTDDEYVGTKIGFIKWFVYNQALAMAYGANMTQLPFMRMQNNSKALLELDYIHISQETVDEIGATTNPNITVIHHFGISTAWKNKGIGEQALKGFIKQMKGKCGYIILRSEPQQCGKYTGADSLYEMQGVELAGLEKDPEKAQWKLNAFFQRCGFRLFKNYDNVFVCNVDQVVASEHRVIKHPVL